jgi:hypothetical protein
MNPSTDTALADAIMGIDLPALIAQHYPNFAPRGEGSYNSPWRQDTRPSLSLSREQGGKWLFNDFTTGQSGNAFGFLVDVVGLSPQQAANEVLAQAGIAPTPKPFGSPLPKPPPPTYAPLGAVHLSALQKAQAHLQGCTALPPELTGRGFTPDMCKAYGLGLYPDGTVLIPIYRGGQTIQIKLRNSDTRMAQQQQARYGYLVTGVGAPAWLSPDFGGHGAVLVAEGELNAMAAHAAIQQQGLGFAVVGMAGAAAKMDTTGLGGCDVYLYADGDAAGQAATSKWAAALADFGQCQSVAVLPPLSGLADFCDIAGQAGLSGLGEHLQKMIVDAQPATTSHQWQPLQPLPTRPTVSGLPTEMLPDCLQAWLSDCARLACVPLEMVAANALCALSGVIGASLTIQARAGFYVAPNIWGGAVASSGSMKTKLLNDATAPLRWLEREAAKTAELEDEDAELELSQAKKQLDLLEKRYAEKKAPRGESVPTAHEVKAARREVQRLESAKPTERTYTTTNCTHEALGALLLDNQKGITVVRDELAPFIASMSREDMAEARGFFNAAWDGGTGYTYHRIGRGKVKLERVCVAICGMIQPKLLDELIARMLADPMQNDGFLQRFQVLVYPDCYPEWVPPEQQAPATTGALERAIKVVSRLNSLERRGTDGSLEPRVLRFSGDAQIEFNQWHDTLERRIRPGGDLANDSAYKSWYAKTKSLCVSLAAIFHLCDLADQSSTWGGELTPISLDALLMALDWCDYLGQHANKVYALELNPDHAAAHAVAKMIQEKKIKGGDTLRDAKRNNRNLPSALIENGLDVLESLGWVRIEEARATGKLDGRPSEVVRLHPSLKGGE